MNLFKIEFSNNRVFGLDCLRAFAIFIVVYGHGVQIFTASIARRTLGTPVLDGVSMFFVLSGFLIGGILIKTVENNGFNFSELKEFWKRRWFRTLPNYFLILFIVFILALIKGQDINLLAKFFIFIQNFKSPHPPIFHEAWSLSVEEWFYLLIPLGVFFIIRLGVPAKQTILLLIISTIIASLCIRYYKYSFYEINTVRIWDLHFRKQVVTRLDSIMFGVLGAYLNYYYNSLWLKYRKPLFFIGIILLIANRYLFIQWTRNFHEFLEYACVHSFTISSIATLFLLPFLCTYNKKSGRIYRAITTISLISYSMYLLHFTIILHTFVPVFVQAMPIPLTGIPLELFTYVLYWLSTICCSIIIYKYYETPFTRLRGRRSNK